MRLNPRLRAHAFPPHSQSGGSIATALQSFAKLAFDPLPTKHCAIAAIPKNSICAPSSTTLLGGNRKNLIALSALRIIEARSCSPQRIVTTLIPMVSRMPTPEMCARPTM
jgi:hypothetical protein